MERPSQFAIEQPKAEQYRHFDILSCVDLARFDLQTRGSIGRETWQRIFDEEFSYLAEGIDRPMNTSFRLQEHDGYLAYYHDGQWQPYETMLHKGIKAAERERDKDFRKQLLVDMALTDLYMYQQFSRLQPGEQVYWYSGFPEKEHQLYGEKFLSGLGFQCKRRMGFIYEATKHEDGSVSLVTQSVDNSNEAAFTAAVLAANNGAGITGAIKAYDGVLAARSGEQHRYGRPVESGRNEENAWEVIQQHRDLIDHYIQGIETLARRTDIGRPELERMKKRLTYGVWATLKTRLDQHPGAGLLKVRRVPLQQEIEASYARLVHLGEDLFGCGGSISGEEALLNADSKDVFDAIWGEDKKEANDSTMRCVHCPKCRTFHDEVKKKGGKYTCKNKECGYQVKA